MTPKRERKRKLRAQSQPDRFLHLHVIEARRHLARKLKEAQDALAALRIAEEELERRWQAFVLTRPTAQVVGLSGPNGEAETLHVAAKRCPFVGGLAFAGALGAQCELADGHGGAHLTKGQ